MAGKDKVDLEDFNLDDFGFDDPMNDGMFPKDNRTPVEKITSGALQGAKESLKSPTFYRGVLNAALPSSYESTFDTIDDVTSEGIGLYNSLREDIRPVARELKRAGRFVFPAVEKVTPKWISERLGEIIKEDSSSSTNSVAQEDAQEGALQQQLEEIFKLQATEQKETSANRMIKDAVDTKRHAANINAQEITNSLLQRIVNYQDHVAFAYQKKSLELKYRTYFATRDLLTITKASTEESLTLLRGITKNTALPDYLKLTTSEAFAEQARQALFGKAQEAATTRVSGFIRDFGKNLQKNLKGVFNEFGDKVTTFNDSADTVQTTLDMAKEAGMDETQLVSEMAGSTLASSMAKWFAGKLRPMLEKNPEVAGGGYALSRMRGRIISGLRNWANSPSDRFDGLGSLIDLVKQSVPRDRTHEVIAQENMDSLTQPAVFSNRAHTSLVDIIPGLLSRILQSSEGIRTGSDQDLLQWNWTKSKFDTRTAIARQITKNVVNKDAFETYQWRAESLADRLDVKVSKETKEKFKTFLTETANNKRGFDPSFFAQPSNYPKEFSPKEARRYAAAFREKLGMDQDGKTKLRNVEAQKNLAVFDNYYNRIGEQVSDSADKAKVYANLGYLDILRQLGLVETHQGTDFFDRNSMVRHFGNYQKRGRNYGETVDEILANGGMVPGATPAGRGSSAPMDGPSLADKLAAEGNKDTERQDAVDRRNGDKREKRGLFSGLRQSVDHSKLENVLRAEVDRVVNTIDLASVKSESQEQLTLLQDILDAVRDIDCSGGGEGGSGKGKRKGLFRRALGGVGRGIGMGAKGLWNLGGGLQKLTWGAVKLPFKGVKGAWDYFKDRQVDIYIPGKKLPVLTIEGFKAGEYFDALTGKVITSYKDVKGAVKNRAGDVILTAEQYTEGLYDKLGKKLDIGKSWTKDKLGKLFGWGADLITSPFKATWAATGSIGKGLINAFTAPPDVYVPGEDSPRMISKLIMSGKYYFTSSGKPIKSVGDIDGAVLNRNGKTLITAEEFGEGLVDEHGKPIQTTTQKIIGIAKLPFKLAGHAWRAAGGASKWMWDKTGNLLKGGKDLLSRGFSGIFGDGGFTANMGASDSRAVEQINVLKKIHNLLCRHFGIDDHLDPTPDSPLGDKLSGLGGKAKKAWKDTEAQRSKLKDDIRNFKDEAKGKVKDKLADHGITEEAVGDFRTKHKLTAEDFIARRDKAKGWLGDKWNNAKSSAKGRVKSLFVKKKGGGDQKQPEADTSVERLAKLAAFISGKEIKTRKSIKERLADKMSSDRRNNWRELLARRKAKSEKSDKAKVEEQERTTPWGKLFTILGGAVSIFSGIWTGIKSLVTGFGWVRKLLTTISAGRAGADIIDGLGGIDTPEGRDSTKGGKNKGPGSKPKGKMGKFLDWGKNLFKGNAGKVAAGTTALETANTVSKGSKLATIARTAWQLSGMGFAFTALGWAARGAMALAVAAATVLSTPVVLGIAAVTALAIGGYYTYKYFRDRLLPLQKLRMAQYGIPLDNKEFCVKTAEVEHYLKDKVAWSGKQAVKLNVTGDDYKQIAKLFGFDFTSTEKTKRFVEWFSARFVPVYLQNRTALASMDNKMELIKVDTEMPDGQKESFANRTMLVNDPYGPYSVSGQPIDGVFIIPGREPIEKVLKEVVSEFGASKGERFKGKDEKTVGRFGNVYKKPSAEEAAAARVQAMANAQKSKLSEAAKAHLEKKSVNPRADLTSQWAAKKLQQPNVDYVSTDARAATMIVPQAPQNMAPVLDNIVKGRTKPGQADQNTAYASIGKPSRRDGKEMQKVIVAASNIVGVDPNLTMAIAGAESNFKADAKNPRSSASGLFQFINGTWGTMVNNYADKYGIPKGAKQTDPVASALLGAQFTKDNVDYLTQRNLPAGPTEAYMMHFMGLPAAGKFLAKVKDDPNYSAAKLNPDAALSNPELYYRYGNPRTVRELYQHFDELMARKTQQAFQAVENSQIPVEETKPTFTTLQNRQYTDKKPAMEANASESRNLYRLLGTKDPAVRSQNKQPVNDRTHSRNNYIQNKLDELMGSSSEDVYRSSTRQQRGAAAQTPVEPRPTRSVLEDRQTRLQQRQAQQDMRALAQQQANMAEMVKHSANTSEVLSKSYELWVSMNDHLKTISDGISAVSTAAPVNNQQPQYNDPRLVAQSAPQVPITHDRKYRG